MTIRKNITTILICLGLLACSGCGSDDGPTVPETVDYETFALQMMVTYYHDLVDSPYWNEGQTTADGPTLYAGGNWNYEPVMVDLGFVVEHPMFSGTTVLATFHSNAPVGCDLVTIDGIPIGATLAQVESVMGAPATFQDNGDGNVQATFQADQVFMEYSGGSGFVSILAVVQ